MAGASYAAYQWTSSDTLRVLIGGHRADNANIRASYYFDSELPEYATTRKRYPIGQKLFTHQQPTVQHYFYPYFLVACIKSEHIEALTTVIHEDGEFKVMDWSIPLIDIHEYRLDLPPYKITEIPLAIDINKATEALIISERSRVQSLKVHIHKSEEPPGQGQSCKGLKKRTPIASLRWPITAGNTQ